MSDLTKDQLLALREKYRSRAFLMMIEVAVIFGVPAFLAYHLGRYFEAKQDVEGGPWLIMPLVAAFILSWVIVIYRYIDMTKRMEEVDQKIRDLDSDITKL